MGRKSFSFSDEGTTILLLFTMQPKMGDLHLFHSKAPQGKYGTANEGISSLVPCGRRTV